MRLGSYEKPITIEDAYQLSVDKENVLIAGGAWLKLNNKEYKTGIDLSGLNISGISLEGDKLVIGAMTTLRELETNEELKSLGNGIISKGAGCIMGLPLKNIGTIGGSVCGRFGFSDLIPPLLAMNAHLTFAKAGEISLEEYLNNKSMKDILISLSIDKSIDNGYFEVLKKTSLDFSVINVAIVNHKKTISVAVGSRPGVAKLIKLAYEAQDIKSLTEEIIDRFTFGSNFRASKEYRKELATVFIERGLMEVTS